MKTKNLGFVACVAMLCGAQTNPASATLIEISAGPSGWGCTTCAGGPNQPDVQPGTTVTLIHPGEPGLLQLSLGPGTYSITNAETTGNFSAWNFEGYPNSPNWVWSFLIGADNGNGTATILKSDYVNGVFSTQALAAGATGTTTWDWQTQLSGTSTAGFNDTLTLNTTTTLDFFIDDYFLPDNGGGVALNIQQTSGVPGPIAGAGIPGLILAGGGLIGWWRRRRRKLVQVSSWDAGEWARPMRS